MKQEVELTWEIEMPPSRSKYKRVTELYTRGAEAVLDDGTVVYCRTLNPFEQEEARHDAQTARSRMIMALKTQGSEELAKVEGALVADGRERAIERLLDAKAGNILLKAVETIKNDPEWVEKLDIMDRSDDLIARPQEDVERQLLTTINTEYIDTVGQLTRDETDFLREKYTNASDEELLEEYIQLYLEHRGTEVAMAEHRVVEIWYGARCCDGVRGEDGVWTHALCDGHKISLFETKQEARDIPEELADLLGATFDSINMSARDARFSDRQGSSSESSPLPSDAGDSKPSTPTEMSESLPGI